MHTSYSPPDLQNIFNQLGMIFLYSPEDIKIYEQYIVPCKVDTLIWPIAIDDDSQKTLVQYYEEINWDRTSLMESWQTVLGGPMPLRAPPYSSVYLDKEQVIFGESYHGFINFLKQCGLKFTLDTAIPEDHMGVMLLALSFLMTDNLEHAKQLLENHLLTWSTEYLTQLEYGYPMDYFYRFIARLTLASLTTLQGEWGLSVKDATIYPYVTHS